MSRLFGNFLEQAEDVDNKDEQDPKQKRLKMIKRQVLMKKVQAVRQGGGEDITASHEPEGEMVEAKEVDKKRHPRDQKELDRAQEYIKKNPKFGLKEEESVPRNSVGKPIRIKDKIKAAKGQISHKVNEAKVDAGKSPETKEKDRNVRKFGVSHNVSGHGKLRRSLHKMNRGDKKIKGDKSAWTEMESVQYEGVGDAVKAGVKRHKDAVEKKKIKNRKAVPYAALAAEHQPEGEMVEEVSRRSKPSAKAKLAKLDAILKRREDKKVSEKEALKTEGLLTKKRPEKKAEKAMDAGARAKRKLQRREYAAKVSGSEDNVPDDIREGVRQAAGNALGYAARVGAGIVGAGVQALSQKETIPKVSGAKKGGSSTSSNQGGMSAAQSQAEKAKKARVDARKKAIKKIKDDRRDRATNIMTAEKAAKKVKKEGEDKKFQADSGKPIVAEFVDHLWEASKKCSKCGKVYKGKSCSCCA